METKSTLLYLKKGDIKKGMLSIVYPCEYRFYDDKIIVRPFGLKRIFNSSDIIILKDEVINIRDGIRLFGYNIIIET